MNIFNVPLEVRSPFEGLITIVTWVDFNFCRFFSEMNLLLVSLSFLCAVEFFLTVFKIAFIKSLRLMLLFAPRGSLYADEHFSTDRTWTVF